MKKVLYYLFMAILLIAGVGLLSLSNQGIIDFNKPYALRLTKRLSPENKAIVFENVNLIPMDRERILENQTVIIRNGMIEQIGNVSDIQIPDDAQIVDGAGKYLLPGLVDMHVHIVNENELLLFAAYGVTSVRNMWGGMNFTDHLGWREQIEQGELLGPTLYSTGPIMEGPPKTMPLMRVYDNPEAAVEAVNQQIEQGYDFIKVYDYIDLGTYEAIIQSAQAQDVRVVGHVPKKVGLDKVLSSGQVTIEHLSGFIDNDLGEFIIPEGKLQEYAELTQAAGVFVCPTIAVYQMYVPKEELQKLEDRPEMVYISPGMKFTWQYFSLPGAMSSVSFKGDYPGHIQEMFLNTTRILHEHGVKFILGTDSDNPYLVPGSSLLDELDYLVEAGFSPYEALETGTHNAAEAMGKLDEFGTIEVGKQGDLILVDSNPLVDVSAVRDRSGVMLRGRWLPETELQSMLNEMVASFRPNWLERIWPLGIIGVAIYLIWRKNQ